MKKLQAMQARAEPIVEPIPQPKLEPVRLEKPLTRKQAKYLKKQLKYRQRKMADKEKAITKGSKRAKKQNPTAWTINPVEYQKKKQAAIQPKQAPTLSSAFNDKLEELKSLFTMAETQKYSKNGAWKLERKTNEAGSFANRKLATVMDKLYLKYKPKGLTEDEIKLQVADKIAENYDRYYSGLEAFLFEFISDGQGSLEHTSMGIQAFQDFIDIIANVKIDVSDRKQMAEAANDDVMGDIFDDDSEDW